MRKYSSHCWSLYINFRIIFKYIRYVIIIGWFRSICVLGVIAIELQKQNTSIESALTHINGIKYEVSMMSPTKIPSTIVSSVTGPIHEFNSTNVTSSDGAVNHGLYYYCRCWNSTLEVTLECRCEGSALQRIPQRLPVCVQRLRFVDAGIKMLKNTGLKIYADTLQDISFNDCAHFESIQAGAFANLSHLHTISISYAPRLTNLSAEVFEGISNSFRSLRILYCGLKRIPDLRFVSTGTILYMVDLEGNQIETIETKSVNIRTDQLIINQNALTYINNSAFFGSEIAKLSLSGNPKLKEIHPSAFVGIINVIELDLSSTSIESLPTDGLENLEILRIQNTHSLKTIPSVYTFQNLRMAWLTHSFHCCAFKFPQRHDPYRHAQRIKYLNDLHKKCMNRQYNSDTGVRMNDNYLPNKNRNESSDQLFHDIRRRRFINNSSNDQKNEISKEGLNNSFEYSLDEDNEIISPITGAPISYADDIDSDSFMSNGVDFGEFMDSTADVSPNNVKIATCGILSIKKIDVRCYPIPDALNPCEDVMGAQWLRISVWIVVFLAVLGNIAVLLVLFSNWRDVTVPKFLMSHLAFADLCLGLYLLLIAAIDIHSMGEYFNFAYDWQYGAGCKVAGFLTVFASHLSVFTLTMITVERWYAITHAINLNKRIKIKTASFIMICGWLYAITMSSLPLFGFSNYSSTSICLPMEARDSLDNVYLLLIIAANALAFCIIAICYARIYFSLGKETRHASHGHEMTVAKKMALLVFTNFACWAPIAFFSLTALAGMPLIDVAKSKILLVFFYPLNSCADPYLYAILTSQYRRDLFMLLSKYGFCTKKAQQYKMNYSLPTTNHTCPVPLIDQRRDSRRGSAAGRKMIAECRQTEDYV